MVLYSTITTSLKRSVTCYGTVLGLDFEHVAKLNIAKLKSRKERGVLGGNGDNR